MKRLHRRAFLKSAVTGITVAGAATLPTELTAHLQAASHDSLAEMLFYAGALNAADPQRAALATTASNPIVAENALQGTADWQLSKPTAIVSTIEGFASATSIGAGEPLNFYISTAATKYDLRIYRLGYYAGLGGRLVAEVKDLPGKVQAPPQRDQMTGLASCSHWSVSHTLSVPADWVSGVYVAKLVRPDTDDQNYILFVVREQDRKSDILLQMSVTTYAAYNPYGGKSLYNYNSESCLTAADSPRAVKVSLDRPGSFPPFQSNSFFWPDFAMVYWLEGQGYDVSYATNIDTHHAGLPNAQNSLLGHHVFVSHGHDEYWSQAMHDAVAAARDAGVNVCFFSSNVSYWRVRLEPDPWTGQPDRIVVCYKTTESGAVDPISPTGTCRDPNGLNAPENALIGMQYIGDNDSIYFPIRVSAEQAQDRIYRHTDLQALAPGMVADIGQRLVGWEWDAVVDNGHSPQGVQVLAATPTHGSLLMDAGRTYQLGQTHANVARYTAPSGASVFATGTNQWAWGLALFEPNPYIQQITCNLLADMGAHPSTPAPMLKLDEGVTGATVAPFQDGTQPALNPTLLGVQATSLALEMKFDRVAETSKTPPPVRLIKVSDLSSPAVLSNVQIAPSKNMATVTWKTNRPAIGQVWVGVAPKHFSYQLSQNGGWRMPVAGNSAHAPLWVNHELTVGSLDPATTYYYGLAVRDVDGQTTFSDEVSFRTAAGSVSDQARLTARTFYRSLPCWLQRNLSWGVLVVVGLVLAGVSRLAWRARTIRKKLAKSAQKS